MTQNGKRVVLSNNYQIFETHEFIKSFSKLPSIYANFIQKKLSEYIYPHLRKEPHFGKNIKKLRGYNPVVIDENTFEVDLSKEERLNEFIAYLARLDMVVTDFRPKGNRIEKLFLNILNSETGIGVSA